MLRVTSAYTSLVASQMKAISHCSTFNTFGKGTRVQDEMAGHQTRRCKAAFCICLDAHRTVFSWASTDVPWDELDDDGNEIPDAEGEWVSTTYQFCSGKANVFEVYRREMTKPPRIEGLFVVSPGDFSFYEYVQQSTCSTTYNSKARGFAVLREIPAVSRRDRLYLSFLGTSNAGWKQSRGGQEVRRDEIGCLESSIN
jgi:hypothetical protein